MKKFFMMSALFFGMACSTFAADDVTGIKLLGDANDDGEVNIADVSAVLSIIANGGNPEGYHAKNSDANKDGEINIADASTILSIIAGAN